MIFDLEEQQSPRRRIDCDILVVGAGIAGLTTATKLSEFGIKVVVVESGGRTQEADTHPLNKVEQTGDIYAGAESGRFRCLGGTSTRWGGAMIPFVSGDLGEHSADWGLTWEMPYERLMTHLPAIESKFGLPSGSYEDDGIIGPRGPAAEDFIARAAKWPPFPMRNFAVTYESAIRAPSGPAVWLNAHVTGFAFHPSGRLSGATAYSPGGKELQITAREVVLAAGAIESTRLLLLADRQCDEKIFKPDDILGRYLHDHLSAPIAELEPRNRAALNRVIGFRFERSAMRNLRFEMTDLARRQLKLPANYTFISYETSTSDGFVELREIFRNLQKRRLPGPADLARTAVHFPWLLRAVWWRYVFRRFLYPSSGTFTAQLVTEQKPLAENRITLSENATDSFGRPLANIHWRVSDEDISAFHVIANHVFKMWRESTLGELAVLLPTDTSKWSDDLPAGGGIYHPGGTIRMGTHPSNGVVDSDLRVFRVPNLYVVSTATFPVGGGANPTLMMILYGFDLATRLAKNRH